MTPRAEVRDEINARRSNRGCERLAAASHDLVVDARRHSRDMEATGTLFPTPASGLDALRPWLVIGEAVGVGETATAVLDALWRSDAHRRVVLDCRYQSTAIGLAWREGVVWVTIRVYDWADG